MALENLGLGAYEARERADLFRRFNTEMVEEMAAMAAVRPPSVRRCSNAPARC
jgi:hypothetical protein